MEWAALYLGHVKYFGNFLRKSLDKYTIFNSTAIPADLIYMSMQTVCVFVYIKQRIANTWYLVN